VRRCDGGTSRCRSLRARCPSWSPCCLSRSTNETQRAVMAVFRVGPRSCADSAFDAEPSCRRRHVRDQDSGAQVCFCDGGTSRSFSLPLFKGFGVPRGTFLSVSPRTKRQPRVLSGVSAIAVHRVTSSLPLPTAQCSTWNLLVGVATFETSTSGTEVCFCDGGASRSISITLLGARCHTCHLPVAVAPRMKLKWRCVDWVLRSWPDVVSRLEPCCRRRTGTRPRRQR
jgi:hypothetical protein